MKSRKFVDSVVLYARAGAGGNGCVSFRREKFVPCGGPDGGDGGRGGNITLKADYDEDSLVRLFFTPHQRAGNGGYGKGKKLHGRNGKDLVLPVPIGTEVHNTETGEMLGDLTAHDDELTIAHGGRGGKGNCRWKTSTHQAPTEHTDGEPGEELKLRLLLKLVSNAGLVGFPNAGKSSLLAKISDAHPRVGAYPFTTLNPVIGTMIFDDYSRLRVADIPGLITGAHDGIGLGHAFLRHIERAAYLIYVLDMAGVDGRLPHDDYASLKREIGLHKKDLLTRPSLLVANKSDLPEAGPNLKIFIKKTGLIPIPISATTGEGIPELKDAIFTFCCDRPTGT